MVKSDLITAITAKIKISLDEKNIELMVNSLLEMMSETLAAKNRIEIRGFGSFSLHYRGRRVAHNPKTGEKLITKEKYTPHFKPGKELRERIDRR